MLFKHIMFISPFACSFFLITKPGNIFFREVWQLLYLIRGGCQLKGINASILIDNIIHNIIPGVLYTSKLVLLVLKTIVSISMLI